MLFVTNNKSSTKEIPYIKWFSDTFPVPFLSHIILLNSNTMTLTFTRIRISQLTPSSPYCFEIDPM